MEFTAQICLPLRIATAKAGDVAARAEERESWKNINIGSVYNSYIFPFNGVMLLPSMFSNG